MVNKLKSYFADIVFCIVLIWKAAKRAFSITLVFKAIEIAGIIANIFVTKYLINQIIDNISNSSGIGYIILLIGIYSLYNLLYQFIDDYGRKVSGIITTELITYLGISVMRKSINLDYEYFDIPEKYNEFLRNQNSAVSLQGIVNDVIQFLGSVVMFLTMCACCLTFSVVWTLVAVVVLIPNYIFSIKFARISYELEKCQYNRMMKRDYIYSLFFTKNDSQELRYGNAIQNLIDQYKELSWNLLKEKETQNAKWKVLEVLCGLTNLLFIPILSIYIVIQIAKQILTLGDFSYVTGIYNNFSLSMVQMIGGISAIYQYDERIKDFRTYYEYIDKEEVSSGDNIDHIESVEFSEVYFKYPGRDEYVLNNLSLKLNAGEKIAIVGLNGSGKTTIFKLLCGFYKPESGRILINGQDFDEINIQSLRKHIAVLFQDYTVYSLSIKDNVMVSDLESMNQDDFRIKEALNMAGFHNAEYDKNEDIGIYVGKEFSQDGIILSGGQRQKLAIARALYRNADMIMLDEPSASLDPESEYHMIKSFERMYKSNIFVMITHKLYSTSRVDFVYCIEKGRVIECGSHDELMTHHGLYYKMFTAQNQKRGDNQ